MRFSRERPLSLQRTSDGWQLTATADKPPIAGQVESLRTGPGRTIRTRLTGHLRISLEGLPQHGS